MESEASKIVSAGSRKKLAAVMFADMVEYSLRLEQDETANTAQAARAIELFKALIGDYGGEVANVSGDGLLALFDSADRALRFAIQIQREFRDQSVWGNGDPIQFRIALNLGEVAVNAGNVQAHCVNVAARLQTLAEPNSILVTAGIRDAVQEESGLNMRTLGFRKLKNISEPLEVFAVELTQPRHSAVARAPAQQPLVELTNAPTIAVLALANFSGDPRNDHICEGVSEDITANLTRFRDLMVIARHSAFLFTRKAMSTSEIHARLGARYILSGSLRRADKRLRIAIELTDATSDSVLWSDRFNLEVEDLFDLQDQIAGAVAARLSVQIEFAERRQESVHLPDMRAYGLVVRGQHLILHFTKEANFHARRLFEEAIEFAPQYSRACSGMSRTHNLDWRYSWSAQPKDSLGKAITFARAAKTLDQMDARGFAELGYALLYCRRHEEALAEYATALVLNPNDSDIIAEYADALVYVDQPSKSIQMLQKAMRLNPYHPDWYLWYLADAYDSLGQYEDVILTVQRMENPAEGRRLLAISYAHLGMFDEAKAAVREVLKMHPEFSISQWRHRPPFRPGEAFDRYIEGLRKAGFPD